MLMQKQNHRGFTLIELLVVIAIIAILAAILFPVFARAREKARATTCTSNQRQIAASIQMYAQDHEEMLPNTSSVWSDIKVDPGVLICPTAGKSMVIGYGYNRSLDGASIGSMTSPDAVMLLADAVAGQNNMIITQDDIAIRHSNAAILAYADGHVEVEQSIPVSLANPTDSLFAGLNSGTVLNGAGKAPYLWARQTVVNAWSSNVYIVPTADTANGDTVLYSASAFGSTGPAVVGGIRGDGRRQKFSVTLPTGPMPNYWCIGGDLLMQLNPRSDLVTYPGVTRGLTMTVYDANMKVITCIARLTGLDSGFWFAGLYINKAPNTTTQSAAVVKDLLSTNYAATNPICNTWKPFKITGRVRDGSPKVYLTYGNYSVVAGSIVDATADWRNPKYLELEQGICGNQQQNMINFGVANLNAEMK